MYQNIPTKVLTGESRLSYVHLSEKYVNPKQGGDPRFSCTLLIPKSDTATKADIDSAIQAAYEAAVVSDWKGARPTLKNALIYDGDSVRTDGTQFGPECKGHWVIAAGSKNRKPQVVHISNIDCELPPQEIYSGMYARVTLNFFAYSNAGGKGIGCGLGNVLKTRDGEPLGGGASAASDFADIGRSATQAAGAGIPGMQVPTTQAAPRINPITGLPM